MLNISPTLAEFTELARTRRVISVHARLLADHITAIDTLFILSASPSAAKGLSLLMIMSSSRL